MKAPIALMACVSTLAVTSFALPAFAQDTGGTPPPTQAATPVPAPASTAPTPVPATNQAARDTNLGDIVVTARRHEESLQRAPVAVAAFSQQQLTRRAITSSFALNTSVPGLTVEADSGSGALPSFAIRGRGQNYGSSAGSVETYFADVPLSPPFQMPTLPPQFFDLSSFQVLKGPQGTLFGRATTGGAVVIVPQAPTNEFGGYARLQGGTHGDFQAEGAINIPIVDDKILLRVAGFHAQRDGYMHTIGGQTDDLPPHEILPSQSFDNVNTSEVRATLLVKPTDNLTNSTIVTYHYDKIRASSGPYLELDFATGESFFAPYAKTRLLDTHVNLDKGANKTWAVFNTTTYDFSDTVSLKNIFGYIDAQGYSFDAADSDGALATTVDVPGPSRPRKNRQLTDEVQLAGKLFNDRLSWIVGGLIDRTREPGALDKINVASVVVTPDGGLVTRYVQNTVNSESVYGSLTYKITDKMNFTAGFRHAWDDVRAKTANQPGYSTTVIPGAPGTACDADFSCVYKYKITPQGNIFDAGVDYHFSPNTMVYGGYKRGYKHGGIDDSQVDPTLAQFGGEKLDDFYLGLKTTFNVGDMRGRFNIEGYYDLYKGLQAAYLGSVNGIITTIVTNIPKTTYRGFDMDFTLEPTRWLEVTGSYSLIDAFNTKWLDNSIPGQAQADRINLANNPLGYVSRNKVSITPRFHTELAGDKGEIAFAPTVSYQDKFYTTPIGAILPAAEANVLGQFNQIAHGGATVPAYTTVDLRVEWNRVMGSRFSVAMNVTNATNKLFYLGNGATLNFGASGMAYGPPRMFSFDVSTKF